MQRADAAENISFILYLVPLVASGVYALSGWIVEGLSFSLPQTVYLTVTKDPYLFLLGFTAVCLAVLIEVYGSPTDAKPSKLAANAQQIQILAIVCLAAAAVSAWSVAGYSLSTGRLFQILLEGRYALIYPLVLFILALLLNPSIHFGFLSLDSLLRNSSLILLPISPLVLYGLWRLHASWLTIISLTLASLIGGLVLLVYRPEQGRLTQHPSLNNI